MSREAILRIKETEDEAERIVKAARAEAEAMRTAAEQAGLDLEAKTEEDTAAELAAMLAEIRSRTAQLGERLESESQEAANALREAVALRRKSAEKIIIRGLEAKCR